MVLTPLPSSTQIPKAAPGHHGYQVDPARQIGLRKAGTAESDLRPLTAMRTCYPVAADVRQLPNVAEIRDQRVAQYGSETGWDLVVVLIRGEDLHLGNHTLETVLASDLGLPGVGRRLKGEMVEGTVAPDGVVTLGGRTRSRWSDLDSPDWEQCPTITNIMQHSYVLRTEQPQPNEIFNLSLKVKHVLNLFVNQGTEYIVLKQGTRAALWQAKVHTANIRSRADARHSLESQQTPVQVYQPIHQAG